MLVGPLALERQEPQHRAHVLGALTVDLLVRFRPLTFEGVQGMGTAVNPVEVSPPLASGAVFSWADELLAAQ